MHFYLLPTVTRSKICCECIKFSFVHNIIFLLSFFFFFFLQHTKKHKNFLAIEILLVVCAMLFHFSFISFLSFVVFVCIFSLRVPPRVKLSSFHLFFTVNDAVMRWLKVTEIRVSNLGKSSLVALHNWSR